MRSTFVSGIILLFVLSCSSSRVKLWDKLDIPIEHNEFYQNPFRDVEVSVTFTRPDGSTLDFWGFYNGENTWIVRCMPDQVGRWTFEAFFSDGSKRIAGDFVCVDSEIPGLISAYEHNPCWFGYRNGEAVLLRSVHVGDRFFANQPNMENPEMIWSDKHREQFLDWAGEQGYNMLSIASHFLNRQAQGRGRGWNTPDLWDASRNLPNPDEFDRMESILDDLAARGMIVYPFAGFFGKNADWPVPHDLQHFYLKYVLARLSPYWNLLFSVAGPEPLHQNTTDHYQYAMEFEDINRLGALIKSLDPYDHLLSVHNRTEASEHGDRFRDKDWYDYATIQGPKTLDPYLLAENTLMNHRLDRPYYAQETLWSGNKWHPDYGTRNLRKNAIVLNMCAATINFADNDGNSSSGFSGSALLEQRDQEKHDIVKQVWDFMESIPFYDMTPAPELVDNGFCLAAPGELYLVYLAFPGKVSIKPLPGDYYVEWINAADRQDRRHGGSISISDGVFLTSPQDGDDWLALIVKE